MKQEPVAWITDGGKGDLGWRKTTEKDIPLYTAPPKYYTAEDVIALVDATVKTLKRELVGLTDCEIDEIAGNVGYGYIDVARAIEAKLKEKNDG